MIRLGRRLRRLLAYGLLVVLLALFLMPLLVTINTSLKTPTEVFDTQKLPSRIYLENFADGFRRIGQGIRNSVMISIPAMLISVFIGTLAAYPLSQLRFRGDRVVYIFMLFGMYIPFQTVLIPLFLIIKSLGLYDTIPGLWLTHTAYGVPFTTLVLRNFFVTIPRELQEASKLDGCGLFGYYWRILLPIARTGIAASLILQFRGAWNEFLFGITLTKSSTTMPVTVFFQFFASLQEQYWGPLMSATLMTFLPTIIVFLMFKKQFVSGLTGVYK